MVGAKGCLRRHIWQFDQNTEDSGDNKNVSPQTIKFYLEESLILREFIKWRIASNLTHNAAQQGTLVN